MVRATSQGWGADGDDFSAQQPLMANRSINLKVAGESSERRWGRHLRFIVWGATLEGQVSGRSRCVSTAGPMVRLLRGRGQPRCGRADFATGRTMRALLRSLLSMGCATRLTADDRRSSAPTAISAIHAC